MRMGAHRGFDDGPGDLGIEQGVAGGDDLEEPLGWTVRQDEPRGAGPRRGDHMIVVGKGGDHQDLGGKARLAVTCLVASAPSMTGRRRSIRRTSGEVSRHRRTASAP